MGLSGLTPVGLAFVIVVLLVMLLGIGAAIWHSWLAPLRRKRQLEAGRGSKMQDHPDDDVEKADPSSPISDVVELDTPILMSSAEKCPGPLEPSDSPDPAHEALTPRLDSAAHSVVFTSMADIPPSLSLLAKREGHLGELSLPPAAHTIERKVRFSTATQDGTREAVWWFF